ncbi:tRNA lysidine(34) synthetase TilS [Staphylococcus pseudintermedius]|uniref:tRNA lysidine(34) synthetase TilS n=1 Tax=Staphylococcus pseudintermedius TaxID=283734 RepID=UPI0001FFAEC1|nr:tRNA lysidine(34) synthetase TilS [Staphylococcus pseudintermedius]ADX77521.1 tRNA(Ile)-lysidine synthetase, putative [Staphylococcus pseudintermedius ED99]EGQ0288210.1 tRNA lysidine(34) synthetase TilS [Staphylococcus pseudintermedius]EGQ0293229.1 tRNA lysidine(34) synthetase TilS [Staphylococcus pseudintermedius]EGQ0374692.1 tRNA lysidine(34) synthetase TilS [Staphylococcus pseudintermedius]EGQ0395936.1 tRNA lysidine(34) synthetase TilS [Staphylococcus pseudintermedius]
MQQNWKATDHIVVAVSTGIDSMVLLHQLLYDETLTYRQLTCLHVHHGLREASEQEATFIQHYCEQHDIPFYMKRLDLSDVVAEGRSIQNDAREMRYQWFDTMMHQLDADGLLTAHHEDDQVETVFYRLFTGKSTRSSLGMSTIEARNGYRLYRPLLNTSKHVIRAYQQQHDVPYFEDTSNASNTYVRNDIRNRILPQIDENAQLKSQQLLKLKAWYDEAFMLMQHEVDNFIERFVTTNAHSFTVSRYAFNALTYHVKILTLDTLLHQFEDTVTISERAYADWLQKLAGPVAQTQLMHTNQWHADIVYDKLVIMAPMQKSLDTYTIQVTEAGTYRFGCYDVQITDMTDLPGSKLCIRSRQTGDRIARHDGHHKKVSRLMIDAKVPAYLRAQIPIIETTHGDILAVGTLYIQQHYQGVIKIQFMGDDIHEK